MQFISLFERELQIRMPSISQRLNTEALVKGLSLATLCETIPPIKGFIREGKQIRKFGGIGWYTTSHGQGRFLGGFRGR
jgi:hypothetical protein